MPQDWGGLLLRTVLALLFLIYLTAAGVHDAGKKEIPDQYVLGICLLAAVSAITLEDPGLSSRLLGSLCVSGPLLLTALAIPGAFGGGDIKLTAAGGLFLGVKSTLVSAVIAFLLGGLYSVWILAGKKGNKKTAVAFGPFLCAGMAAGVLWGNRLADWYLH